MILETTGENLSQARKSLDGKFVILELDKPSELETFKKYKQHSHEQILKIIDGKKWNPDYKPRENIFLRIWKKMKR